MRAYIANLETSIGTNLYQVYFVYIKIQSSLSCLFISCLFKIFYIQHLFDITIFFLQKTLTIFLHYMCLHKGVIHYITFLQGLNANLQASFCSIMTYLLYAFCKLERKSLPKSKKWHYSKSAWHLHAITEPIF